VAIGKIIHISLLALSYITELKVKQLLYTFSNSDVLPEERKRTGAEVCSVPREEVNGWRQNSLKKTMATRSAFC
jgi:hypothetical protein